MRPFLSAALYCCATIAAALAQTQAQSFEAAAIKRSAPAMLYSGVQTSPGGRVEVSHLTVKGMIAYAYNVRDFQISGGPAWANGDMYDVVARIAEPAAAPQLRAAMQALLQERFQLGIRRETKELPVYELVLSKKGAKLQESTGHEGFLRFRGKGQVEAHSSTMSQLAQYLATLLDRPVIDATELAANYDFTLTWSPDEGQNGKPGAQGEGEAGGASIFTALQEELGLKLNSGKGPVETIAIERVERPSVD